MKKKKEEFNIQDILGLFAPKIWLIAIVALVLGFAMGGYSAFIKDDTYTSTARLMVSKNNNTNTVSSSDITLASDMVETYGYVIFTDNFLKEIINDVKQTEEYAENNWNITSKYLRNVIKIEQCGETEVFDVIVTTTDAKLSFVISTALANHIRDTLPDILPYADSIIASTIIDDPAVAASPNSKNVVRNTILGVLAGAILAMIAIFIYSLFDVTIRDRKDIEDNFDVPVLGVIPRYVSDEENKYEKEE